MTMMPRFTPRREATIEAQVSKVISPLANEAFVPLPTPTGSPPYRLALSSITTDPTDELIFHAIGDTGGIVNPTPQQNVAAAMLADPDYANISFALHHGDVDYFLGTSDQYYPQFYEPYEKYDKPIVACPGNHDGPNINVFAQQFCAPSPAPTPESMDSERDAMIQPNVYWTLTANLVTIINMYTNVPSGGVVKPDQAAWLTSELKAAPTDRPVVINMHHPAFSADAFHGGSASMASLLDNSFSASGRTPSMVLAGHVHDYQRFALNGVTYIVNGGGGYHNLHKMMSSATPGMDLGNGITLEQFCDDKWGFLRLSFSSAGISGEYIGVDSSGNSGMIDNFNVK